ncbi:phenylalanine--tRNA ligase subunit beta [Derxia gummosa]|uniref:Phenylalanine--tRNA ligase beta subunit n=1 Tax=Derxia gummosa DSM 723 TaxID=1121388 RepID=A0A8B6X6T5_9BURK|nr:phenylalanine--tRNA ligase subunit beta [Derxia gummosa]
MQFSESWLRSFVNPPVSTAELSHLLTMAGLEVEEERPAAPPFSKIVVAEIKSIEKHPDADKLRICQVDAGTGELLQIVCGAPNAAAGIRIPCALVGAELPPGEDGKPFRIKLGKLRGVASHGMLCSARELGLSQDHAGLMLLPGDAPVGEDIRKYLELDDTVFVIKLTPDKGHCLSLLGIAREVAAITGAPLNLQAIAAADVSSDEKLPVRVEAADLCGRFSGRVIRGLDARAPTPQWMKSRLERAGQRSISALVDISNYVMLELGRPSHVFDLAKISGGLVVRWAKAGEELKLLNGSTVSLDESVGVIADAHGIESLAGIMGGDSTAVSLDTTDVYVECAFWWPDSIRGRARRYNFSTDAGHRFERGVDATTTAEHLERLTQLLLDICGTDATRVGPVDDHVIALPERKPVRMRVARAARILGVEVPAERCAQVFAQLGFSFTESDGVFEVTPPGPRFDIEIEEDLIEEVARIVGYENIPVRPPVALQRMRATPETRRPTHALRRALAALGYVETVNYAFVEEAWERDFAGNADPIRLVNPIASQMSVMRSSLLGSLVSVLRYNLNRRAERVAVFELGRVFLRDAAVADGLSSVAGIAQPLRVGGLVYGPSAPEQWGVAKRPADFFDVKADVEALCAGAGAVGFERAEHVALHPGRSARVLLDGVAVGFIGELHPKLQQAYELPVAPVVFELDVEALRAQPLPKASIPPRFQPVRRDLAIVVDQAVSAGSALDCMRATVAKEGFSELVRELALFDEYRGKGLLLNEKSLAFRIVLQDNSGTLRDEQIESVVARIVAGLEAGIGARLRA